MWHVTRAQSEWSVCGGGPHWLLVKNTFSHFISFSSLKKEKIFSGIHSDVLKLFWLGPAPQDKHRPIWQQGIQYQGSYRVWVDSDLLQLWNSSPWAQLSINRLPHRNQTILVLWIPCFQSGLPHASVYCQILCFFSLRPHSSLVPPLWWDSAVKPDIQC